VLIPPGAPHLISERTRRRVSGQTAPVHLRPVGRDAALAEVGDARAALSLATWARALPVDAVDVVPAAETVLFDGVPDVAALAAQLDRWSPGGELPVGELVEVPVTYDGEDLDTVASLAGLSREDVVRRHLAGEYVAAFCGFAPGFAYLDGLDPALHVARLDSPRTRVPAGAVAVADRFAAVYPRGSPGGWRLLGRTDAALWDADRDPPARLVPGTRVRFVEAGTR
jgi:KipI family sensor histidine kinase inhibitor